MTLDDLRRTAEALGSTGRLARVVGRAPDTIRGWLRGDEMGRPAAAWLPRVHAITPAPTRDRPYRVLIDVDAPPGAEARTPRG